MSIAFWDVYCILQCHQWNSQFISDQSQLSKLTMRPYRLRLPHICVKLLFCASLRRGSSSVKNNVASEQQELIIAHVLEDFTVWNIGVNVLRYWLLLSPTFPSIVGTLHWQIFERAVSFRYIKPTKAKSMETSEKSKRQMNPTVPCCQCIGEFFWVSLLSRGNLNIEERNTYTHITSSKQGAVRLRHVHVVVVILELRMRQKGQWAHRVQIISSQTQALSTIIIDTCHSNRLSHLSLDVYTLT